jgi:hypothetical protein
MVPHALSDVCPLRLLFALVVVLTGMSSATAQENPDWKRFRDAHPLHTQVIALSPPDATKTRTLIVAEPPPHVTFEAVEKLGTGFVISVNVATHKLGYDGWVRDLVIRLPDDPAKLDTFLAKLQRLVFHTGYKASVLDLPHEPSARGQHKLEFKVSAADLSRWVLDGKEEFAPVEGGPALKPAEVFDLPDPRVLMTAKRRGLVGWWLPKGKTVADSRREARQFALDSDLVLGAIEDKKGVLILGRERAVAIDVFPPLRVETLELLNAIKDEELAQSFERNHPLAGKLSRRDDWGPIYLSPVLRDTELGSVLNIADQILKGWSNSDNTKYVRFDYPPPGREKGPFEKPAPKYLGVRQLVYNWNTRGAGYVVRDGDRRVYALNRTGCLPISYIPDGLDFVDDQGEIVREAEQKAYDWFATRNDPYLARAVQYLAFYQIFRQLDVARPVTPPPGPDPGAAALKAATVELLQRVGKANGEQRKEFAAALKNYWKAMGEAQEEDEFFDDVLAAFGRAVGDLKPAELRDEIDRLFGRMPPKKPAFALAVPVLPKFAAALRLHDALAQKMAASARGWIHTPAAVVSGNEGSLVGWHGGHNYSARAVRFQLTAEEKYKGKPAFDPTNRSVILVHRDDFGLIGDLARPAGMRGVSAERMLADLSKAIARNKPIEPRSLENALGLAGSSGGPPPPPDKRGMASPGGERGSGWWRAGPLTGAALETYREYRKDAPRTVMVRRDANGYALAYGERGDVVRVRTLEDATEAALVIQRLQKVGAEEPLRFVFQGFEVADAQLFTSACRVRAQDERADPNIVGYVVGKDGVLNPKAYEADIRKKYNFAGAEVKAVDVDQTADGGYLLTITIDIPTGQSALREKFPKGAAKEDVKSYGERLKKLLTGAFGRRVSPGDLRARILLEQKNLRKDLNLPPYDPDKLNKPGALPWLEFQFRQGVIDFSVVRQEPQDVPGPGLAS